MNHYKKHLEKVERYKEELVRLEVLKKMYGSKVIISENVKLKPNKKKHREEAELCPCKKCLDLVAKMFGEALRRAENDIISKTS
jgi:hypothetical protein